MDYIFITNQIEDKLMATNKTAKPKAKKIADVADVAEVAEVAEVKVAEVKPQTKHKNDNEVKLVKIIDIPMAENDNGIHNVMNGFTYTVNQEVADVIAKPYWQVSQDTVDESNVKTLALLKRLYHRGYTNRRVIIK